MALTVWILVISLAATIAAIGAQMCTLEIQLDSGSIPGDEVGGIVGENLRLRCIVTDGGTPITLDTYTWTFNGAIQSTGDSLDFTPLETSDGGEYRCTGTSSTCTDVEMSPVLTVSTPPVIITDSVDVTPLTLTVGGSLTLNCQASGWPTPTVNWFLSGNPTPVASGSAVATYDVISAGQEDSGMYICEASNSRDTVSVEVSITVEAPATALDLTGMPTTGNSVESRAGNGTDDPLGFYIAIGVTAGVSLGIGMLSLLCCLAITCTNCLRRTKPEGDYSDWPDGEEKADETRMESIPEAEERGDEEEGASQEGEDEIRTVDAAPSEVVSPSEVSPSEVSPSEVGEIV